MNFWLIGELLHRPLCALIGCRTDHPQSAECDRCGAWIYGDWIEASMCSPLQRWRSALTSRFQSRCANCDKPLPWRQRIRHPRWPAFCSRECAEGWIPF